MPQLIWPPIMKEKFSSYSLIIIELRVFRGRKTWSVYWVSIGSFDGFYCCIPPPNPPIAYMLLSGPKAIESSSRFINMSGIRDHLPFFKSRQSNFLSTLPFDPVPLLPPQKYIRASSRLIQAEKPDLAFGILNGKTLNVLCFKLYSSISAVLWPSACLPPKMRILVFEIGTAENFVLGLEIDAISFQIPLWVSKASQLISFLSLNPEKTKMCSSFI